MQHALTSPLREARLKKGLTQSQLGDQLGVSKSAVSAWETGREAPEARKLAGLDRALAPHLDISDYLSHVEAANEAGATA